MLKSHRIGRRAARAAIVTRVERVRCATLTIRTWDVATAAKLVSEAIAIRARKIQDALHPKQANFRIKANATNDATRRHTKARAAAGLAIAAS